MLVPVERTSFAAGQIDTAARQDNQSAVYGAGCSVARNHRILNANGIKRRPGSVLAINFTSVGAFRGVEFVDLEGNSFKLLVSNNRLDIYDVNNSFVATITGLPWTTAILDQLYYGRSEGTLVIAHQSFWPQSVQLNAGTWTCANFVFDTAFSGGPAQPYYRYGPKLVTMQPSALTGSITLTLAGTGSAVFVSGHVGAYFRYLGNAILITAVGGGGTTATGTVQGELPQTVTFSVSNASNFAVDEQAGGLTSGAVVVITNISGTTITAVYVSNFGGLQNGETLVGDSSKAQATLTSGTTNTTPAAVVDWDEQVWSAARGYPGGVQTHRGRLYFYNFRDLPRGLTGSGDGLPNYFLVGANDGDPFFELVPDYKGQRVVHVIEAAQGLVLTDQATYVMPEVNAPVTPSTIDFNRVAPVGASPIMPIATEQGFAFVEAGANRVMGILPTGSISAPWEVKDVSLYWSELLTGPVAMGENYRTAGFPERYGFVINADGTAACVKYGPQDAPVPVGWTRWDTANGKYHGFFTAAGNLFAVVERSTPAAWTLEWFTDIRFLDCISFFTDPSAALLSIYENTTVAVMNNNAEAWYQGSYAVNGSGFLQGCSLPVSQYWAGYDYTTEFSPTPPIPGRYGFPSPDFRFGMNIGIPRLYLHVVETTAYTVNGQVFGGTGAQASAPTLFTGSKRWKIPGRSPSLAPDITQQIPGPLQIAALTMEVSY